QGNFWPVDLGIEDYNAVMYGYKDLGMEIPAEEISLLDEIADKMKTCGLDREKYNRLDPNPECNSFDLGPDLIDYCEGRISIAKEIWTKLEDYYKGKSPGHLALAFKKSLEAYLYSAHTATKYIGGVYDKTRTGEKLTAVPGDEQRRALRFLIKNFFEEDSFKMDFSLLKKLEPTRTKGDDNIDGPVGKEISNLQDEVLKELLSEDRIVNLIERDTGAKEEFSVDELFSTLRKSIFSELYTYEKNKITSFKRNLQRMYLNKLILIYNACLDPRVQDKVRFSGQVKVFVEYELKEIDKKISEVFTGGLAQKLTYNDETRSHLKDMQARIYRAGRGIARY
ncbi:MAG: zinc-dependent metalloprotease, partial [Armatimonadota bacterium]